MKKISMRGVRITAETGGQVWAGCVSCDEAPEGLVSYEVDVLEVDGEYWILSGPIAVPHLSFSDLEALRQGELRRATLSKLTDEELEALGVKRG